MYKVQRYIRTKDGKAGWATISWSSSFSIEWGIFERHCAYGRCRFVANDGR